MKTDEDGAGGVGVCGDEGLGGVWGGGDEVATPFMTHTIKLPMRQQISGFWDSLPRLISSCFTHPLSFHAGLFLWFSLTVFPSEQVLSVC